PLCRFAPNRPGYLTWPTLICACCDGLATWSGSPLTRTLSVASLQTAEDLDCTFECVLLLMQRRSARGWPHVASPGCSFISQRSSVCAGKRRITGGVNVSPSFSLPVLSSTLLQPTLAET